MSVEFLPVEDFIDQLDDIRFDEEIIRYLQNNPLPEDKDCLLAFFEKASQQRVKCLHLSPRHDGRRYIYQCNHVIFIRLNNSGDKFVDGIKPPNGPWIWAR